MYINLWNIIEPNCTKVIVVRILNLKNYHTLSPSISLSIRSLIS
jgi:hypothetical protein